MADATRYQGWPIPNGPGGPPESPDGRAQLRAMAAAADLDFAQLAAAFTQLESDALAGKRFLQTVAFTVIGANNFNKGDYAGLRYVVAEVWSGGGGSGGTAATAGGQAAQAAGGGGGGYSRKLISAASLATTETVTLGALGAAGAAAGPTAGGQAGTTSFGSHCQATGGFGGATGTATSTGTGRQGGAGGVGSGGDLNLTGNAAPWSMVFVASPARNGNGGAAPLMGLQTIQGAPTAAGVAGVGYGSGAAGAIAGASASAQNGAAGGPPLVLVHVYV